MNTITREIQNSFDLGQQFTMTDLYEMVTVTEKKHSIRARIYEGVEKGLFEKVARAFIRYSLKTMKTLFLFKVTEETFQ